MYCTVLYHQLSPRQYLLVQGIVCFLPFPLYLSLILLTFEERRFGRLWTGMRLTLTKHFKKKLDGNCTRMLRAVLNKSWKQHPTKQQLYGHLPPISKTNQVQRTKHVGNCLLIGIILRWGFLIWELIFIYCGRFVLTLVVFCFVSSFTTFRPNFTSGLLQVIFTATSDRNDESCNRIPSNYCLP